MKKSVVQMGHHNDGGDIETSSYAIDRATANPVLLGLLEGSMEGYQYGEPSREIQLSKGNLFLVQVDEGLYTGFFRNVESLEGGDLEDNAKVRIEKQTLPTLAQLITAKGWWLPKEEDKPQSFYELEDLVSEAPDEENWCDDDYEALSDRLNGFEDPQESITGDRTDRKILMLQLLDRLLN